MQLSWSVRSGLWSRSTGCRWHHGDSPPSGRFASRLSPNPVQGYNNTFCQGRKADSLRTSDFGQVPYGNPSIHSSIRAGRMAGLRHISCGCPSRYRQSKERCYRKVRAKVTARSGSRRDSHIRASSLPLLIYREHFRLRRTQEQQPC